MKKLYILLSLMTLLILASCSSSTSDMHSMDNGSEMQWATHEESQEVKEKTISPIETQVQENETQSNDTHGMDDGSEMPWVTHEESQEIDEESVVWDGSMHNMDDGTNMDGATHEESQDHVEWDTHGMDDGSEMQWSSHSEWM